ncbi:MAG: serine dehydratase subunit alpha family protein [Lachnospiraceae bacterium]|nr:serine dehydratase subunit alpha family protein [Lachnospiraceae bacterium]
MSEELYQNHLAILKEELLVALGCTEPIAIAFAAAKARTLLGEMPKTCHVRCSGNIVKNVKAVIVPNSGNMRGIEVAATLGIVGGDADRELAVLESVTEADIQETKELLKSDFCTCSLAEGVDNLYIVVELKSGKHSALVELKEHHNHITRLEKDGEVLFEESEKPQKEQEEGADRMWLNVENILAFAEQVRLSDVEELLSRQIEYNTAISNEGLKGRYGVETGRILLENAKRAAGTENTRLRARAAAAAGSDARMSGCSLPVVINSGSGNQGITVTMPIVIYAKELGADTELLYRALVLGNLLSVHQKKYIGSLSAYCGATSAATGAACGIAYMQLKKSGEQERIYGILCDTITNSIETLGGMVCDGAKASCAAKIGLAVENALMALELSLAGNVFQPGEGMTMENPEDTIAAVGRMGRVGMKSTDVEILNIMLGN